jgi:hypothetical protein
MTPRYTMNPRYTQRVLVACLVPTAFLLLADAPAGATPPAVQHVTVTTTGLTAGQTYYTEFTLTDGSNTGDGNSTAAVSNLVFTNGTAGAALPSTSGNVTGSPGTTLMLHDGPAASGALADYAQGFTVLGPTSQFSFDLLLGATSVDVGATPDNFTFQILGSTQSPLATNGPTGVEFVTADYTSTTPLATSYHSMDLSTPVTAAATAPVPVSEASSAFSLGLFSLGLGGLILRSRRRTRPAG